MSAAATSLGNALRQERLRKELNLAGIAKETRICIAILEAIERDQFECIPGGSYRRHFLRQYACALGMDGDAVVAEFKRQYEEPPLPLPVPPKRSRSPVWAELAWTIAVIASLALAYRVGQNVLAAARHQLRAVAQTEPQGQAARSNLPPAIAPSAAKATPPPPTAPVHVSFTATEPVWLSVKCDGNMTYAGFLDQLQSKTFDATGAVTALVGNAGGLQVSVNGKSVGSIGAHGEVETIELTMNGARRIARPPGSRDTNVVPQL